MPSISLVKLAHSLVKGKVKSGDIAIDATVGNGYDTLFLLELVKPMGKIYGFDIQQSAIDSAKKKLQGQSTAQCLTLFCANHADMPNKIPTDYHGKINAVMFNLGYLPGSDKRIITHTETTLTALFAACNMLSDNGIITIIAYPGHEGGENETDRVKNWCLALDPSHFEAQLFESQNENPSAPKLFVVNKISYDVRHFDQPNRKTMPEFNNVTVVKKANVYFGGNVSSRTLKFSDGSVKTLGFMLPGEYTFNTADEEIMEILDGDVEVLLPDSVQWQKIKGGEDFTVPANAKFTVKIHTPTDYCCSFIK